MKFEWTEERTAKLIQLWQDGCTGTEIAAHFGNRLTRCAVIGKVHRLGLPHRIGPDNESALIKSRMRRKATVAQRYGLGQTAHVAPGQAKRAAPLPPMPPEPKSACTTPLEALREDSCRWADNQSGRWLFCGCRAVPGMSWCEAHRQKVFKPAAEQGIRRRVIPERQITFYELERENS